MHTNQDIESRDDESLEPRRTTGGRRWVRVTLWVMVIALVGWYFLGENTQRSDIADRNRQEMSDLSSPAFPTPLTIDESDASRQRLPETSLSSAHSSTKKGDQAREMIKRIRDRGEVMDLDKMFEHAERFKDKGMLVDAHLMYFFGARQGHAESALILGTMYDPEHALEIPSVIDEPDWRQAHKWYLRAAEGGSETARKRLEYLRKQVERAAANGDPEAGRLVLQWQ